MKSIDVVSMGKVPLSSRAKDEQNVFTSVGSALCEIIPGSIYIEFNILNINQHSQKYSTELTEIYGSN